MSTLLFLIACGPSGETVYRPNPSRGDSGAFDTGAELNTDSGGDPGGEEPGGEDTGALGESGPCPTGMLAVAGQFCVDAFEASLEERVDGEWRAASPYETVYDREVRAVVADGIEPQGYISGAQAAEACEAAGKRLCTSEEWLEACRGPDGSTWPYGDSYRSGACNDSYGGGHPVTDYFGTSDGVWDGEHMNDPGINQQPGTVAAGGAYADCISDWGAYDMHGNLHEWVSDSDGTFRGGFYADGSINGSGCGYATTAHSSGYHDYSTGFRCCSDL